MICERTNILHNLIPIIITFIHKNTKKFTILCCYHLKYIYSNWPLASTVFIGNKKMMVVEIEEEEANSEAEANTRNEIKRLTFCLGVKRFILDPSVLPYYHVS